MRKVTVPKPKNDSLVAQLYSLYVTFKNVSPEESLNFDLSKLDWAWPLLTLPLSAYMTDTKSEFVISNSNNVKSYLDTVRFPGGVNSVSLFKQQIQQYKTYIPISVLEREAREPRERLESLFAQMVHKICCESTVESQDAIYYPIGELVTNIFEHSKRDNGFIFGQFYPKKNYLNICIIDRGRGLKVAYQQEKGLHLSDEEAIAEAMKGTSTKPDIRRGYGVWTSKKIVCDGLGGEFVLLSGSAALISTNKKAVLVSMPNFNWQGVIVAYRIPKPNRPIDIYQYVE